MTRVGVDGVWAMSFAFKTTLPGAVRGHALGKFFVAHLRGGQINHLAGPGQRLGLGQPAFAAARAANKKLSDRKSVV